MSDSAHIEPAAERTQPPGTAERHLAGLEIELRDLRAQVLALGARLVAAEQDNADLVAARAELTRAETELVAVRDEANALRRERDALIASTTWRVTEPGRKVAATMRRVLGKVRR